MEKKNLADVVTSEAMFWAQYEAWLRARVSGYGWNTTAYNTAK